MVIRMVIRMVSRMVIRMVSRMVILWLYGVLEGPQLVCFVYTAGPITKLLVQFLPARAPWALGSGS